MICANEITDFMTEYSTTKILTASNLRWLLHQRWHHTTTSTQTLQQLSGPGGDLAPWQQHHSSSSSGSSGASVQVFWCVLGALNVLPPSVHLWNACHLCRHCSSQQKPFLQQSSQVNNTFSQSSLHFVVLSLSICNGNGALNALCTHSHSGRRTAAVSSMGLYLMFRYENYSPISAFTSLKS